MAPWVIDGDAMADGYPFLGVLKILSAIYSVIESVLT